MSNRFSPTLSCLQRRPLAARFISQGPNILLGITVPCLKEKNGMFSFLPFLIALICREEARYDQHEQHRTRRSPKIFQPIGVKHWRSFSQLEWNVKCVSKIWLTASYMQKCISNGHLIRYQGHKWYLFIIDGRPTPEKQATGCPAAPRKPPPHPRP